MGGCLAAAGLHTPEAEPKNQYKHDPTATINLFDHPAFKRLKAGKLESVVVCAGAGISVSAGIPDFRSPGTGLYDNLQKYNLPHPQAVFELKFFRKNPEPFTLLAKELWPSNFQPTPAHFFVKMLQQKGMLLRHFTQNIDGLDRAAGISDERLVEAHGSFGAGACINCKKPYTAEVIREVLFRGEVVRCTCGGLVKPNIVFFGENLPEKFWRCSNEDMCQRNLVVICMGTSLQVQPFASLAQPGRSPAAYRILINRELPETFDPQPNDLILLGDCDAKVLELSTALGWAEDLDEVRRFYGT